MDGIDGVMMSFWYYAGEVAYLKRDGTFDLCMISTKRPQRSLFIENLQRYLAKNQTTHYNVGLSYIRDVKLGSTLNILSE